MSKHDTSDSVLQHALLTILETIEQEISKFNQLQHFDPNFSTFGDKL
jgi:hypothetical protein